MRAWVHVALVAALMAPSTPLAAAPGEGAAFDAAAARIIASAKENKVVGGSLYLIDDGRVVGARHFGFADEAARQKVDANTIYHWGSITKTFTAIAIMQLAERRLISLDDPIVKYVPEFAEVHNPFGPPDEVTLRHLLTHTSGFRDPTWPWNPDESDKEPDWASRLTIDWPAVMAMMPYSGIAFEPGSKYSYSNPGFSLLGLVIEKVTGDDVEAYIDKNIFAPLGMTRTYFDVTPYHLEPSRSNSYTWEAGKRIENGRDFDTGSTTANGGLNAPVGDMIRYANFLLGVGNAELYERILPRRTLIQMWEPLHKADYDPTVDERMGEAFFTIDAKGDDGKIRRFVGHTGSQQGYRAFIYILPGTRSAAIFAVNTTTIGNARPFVFNVRRDLFEHVFPKVRGGR